MPTTPIEVGLAANTTNGLAPVRADITLLSAAPTATAVMAVAQIRRRPWVRAIPILVGAENTEALIYVIRFFPTTSATTAATRYHGVVGGIVTATASAMTGVSGQRPSDTERYADKLVIAGGNGLEVDSNEADLPVELRIDPKGASAVGLFLRVTTATSANILIATYE